ncbi:unnamed protein product [Onchocerca ochengi]|uniref:Terminase small subunit n=1 Tax=Onchocerca ochengi TaxID=42157 RepID=A0A182EF67_ONCOC|nr:unnamed protein product [Onchocerca ochengi]
MPSSKGKKAATSTKNEFDEQDIKEIEEMAEILEKPSAFTPEKHIAALLYFRNLSNRINLDQCRKILGQ